MRYLIKVLVIFLLISLIGPSAMSNSDYERKVVEEVMNRFGLDSESFEIEILSNRLKVETLEEYDLDWRPLTQKEPIGLYTILVTISDNRGKVGSGQVRMRIRKFASVAVTADRITRSDLIDSTMLVMQRMEVTNLVEAPLTSLAEVEGYRARRNLRKGTIVTKRALEAIPDIERGHETLIVYNDGLCRITAPGVALQSGLKGDIIKVKNKATKKIIVARIIDDRAVAVEP